MHQLSTRLFTADRLAQMVAIGDMAMPDFQRDFVWPAGKVVDFLESVASQWPVGSLLLLESPPGLSPPFAPKAFDCGPDVEGSQPSFYVLDCQQRLTALFHALYDVSPTVYYVDRQRLMNGDPDIIRAASRDRLRKLLEAGRAIPVAHISDSERAMLSGLADEAYVVEELWQQLPGLLRGGYQVPAVVLPWDLELAALAKIFGSVNRAGVRLNAFDLMVAVLYPQDFHLRKQWRRAKADEPMLDRFDVNGLQVLKIVALARRREEVAAGRGIRVRGVRQSDVLRVPGDFVQAHWAEAVAAYVAALEFAHARLGLVRSELVPSEAMLLTLAVLLGDKDSRSVESWFWSSCLSQSYSQGANTQVVADVDARSQPGLPLDVDVLEVLSRPITRNGIAARGLLLALIADGAQDLTDGSRFADMDASVEIQWRSMSEVLGTESATHLVGELVLMRRGSLKRVQAALQRRDPDLEPRLRSQRAWTPIGEVAKGHTLVEERVQFYSQFLAARS